MLICGMFFIPETFAEAINYKPYQESMILVIDQPNQEAYVKISLMSKSNEDFMISDQLEEKIKNTKGLVSIQLTNQEECIIGVEDDTCILVTLSRIQILNPEQFNLVQDEARKIGNSLIEDLDNLFLRSINSEVH